MLKAALASMLILGGSTVSIAQTGAPQTTPQQQTMPDPAMPQTQAPSDPMTTTPADPGASPMTAPSDTTEPTDPSTAPDTMGDDEPADPQDPQA